MCTCANLTRSNYYACVKIKVVTYNGLSFMYRIIACAVLRPVLMELYEDVPRPHLVLQR